MQFTSRPNPKRQPTIVLSLAGLWRALLHVMTLIGLSALLFTTVNAARLYAPVVAVTMTDAFVGVHDSDGKADPGETIQYTAVINNTGVVPGTDDATGVTFTDTIDPNTTLVGGSVSASPVGVNDTFPVTVTGNISINSAVLASPFSVTTNDYLGQNPEATIAQVQASTTIVGDTITTTTTNGGNVVMTVSGVNMGFFTYDPPAGFEGTDTFTYVLSDNANATSAASNRTATVSITVSGMVWFVNNNATACTGSGCGRLSNPFSTLAAFNALNDNAGGTHPGDNDNIFIYESANPYTGGITLRSGQKLIGQDSTQALSALTGVSPVTGSASLPVMNTGAPTTVIQNGITLNSNNTLNGLTAGNASGSAISGSGFGTLTAANVIIDTTGQALSLTNGTLNASFSSVTSTGGVNNIALAKGAGTLTGTLTISDGALSGATGNAFDVNGGTAIITNSATITSGSARSVNVTGLNGGTVTFNGAINDTDTGISLTSNTGATINFTGVLTVSTGTNPAFTATGGGTVSATNTASTLTTTTATALNVTSTNIGASNLIFRSISSSGGSATGIILNNTGAAGGLQVLGDGSNASFGGNGSGGTITNKTGTDGDNATGVGIYLNNTSNVVLRRMNLSNFENFGIRGFNVNNFILEYCTINHGSGKIGNSDVQNEGAVSFGTENPGGTNGLTGTATVTSCLIEDGFENNFKIANLSGTLSQFTMTGTTIRDTSVASPGNNGFEIRAQGTANITADISGSTFTGNRTNGVQVSTTTDHAGTVDVEVKAGSTFTNNNIGANIANGGSGTLYFDVLNSTFNSSPGQASPININLAAGGGGPMHGYITGNAITNANSPTGPGIRVVSNGADGDSSNILNIEINGNNISQVGNRGIEVIARDGNSRINARVLNNTINLTDPLSADGIRMDAGAVSTDTTAICAYANGNTSTTVAGVYGVRVRQRFAGTNYYLQGYVGGATDMTAVQNFLSANNNSATTLADFGGGGFQNATCASPVARVSPQIQANVAEPEPAASVVSNESLESQASSEIFASENVPGRLRFGQTSVRGGKPLFSVVQPAPVLSGETIPPVSIGTLPAGKSVTIVFDVTVDNPQPLGKTEISNQASISGSNFTTILTDDPDVVGAANPTVTQVDRPDATVTSINRDTDSSTNATSVSWTVTFDTLAPASPDGLTGLTSSNFALVNGGLTGPSITSVTPVGGSPSNTWTVTASTGTGDGTLGLNLVNDTSLSHDVTTAQPVVGQVYTVDKTAPTTTSFIRQNPASSPTNADTLVFRATFSEALTAIDAGDFSVTGTTATISSVDPVGAGIYDITVSGGDLAGLDGTVGLNFSLSMNITDLAGNALANTEPATDQTYVLDNTPPSTVSFSRQSPTGSLTNVDALIFSATFSEAVSNVSIADFSVTGSTATVTAVNQISGSLYYLTVSGGDLASYNGVVGLNFSGSLDIVDQIGNPLPSTEPATDETYTLDNIAPTVTINQAAGQADPTNASPINFTVVFSEAVTGFTFGDVTLGGTAGATTRVVSEIAPNDGTTYNVAVSGMTGDGTVTVSIPAGAAQDLAINLSAASTSTDSTVTYDASAPTVTINQAAGQSDPTGSSPINFTVLFSEPVTGFATGDVTLSGGAGATTDTVTEIAPNDGTTYNVAVSGMTGDGLVIASLAAGVAQDSAGNTNALSTSTDNSVLFDTVAPSVTIVQAVAQDDPTDASPINFTVTFSEDVTDFDDPADVTLTGTAGATTINITGGPKVYNVAVSGMTTSGTVIAAVPAGVAVDLASQPNTASSATGDRQVTYIPPTDLAITKTDGVASATPGGSVTYTITASNAGPNADPAATVTDTFPASLTATWTCVGAGGGTCTASGSGNINDTVNLPVGGSVTYTVSATISPSATGSLSNTATVASSISDISPANNFATDTDTLAAQADLSITKTDGVTTAIPGGSITYTITVSNAGPSDVSSATVADTFPAILTANWTCVGAGGGTCAAVGSGNISDTVNLPVGGSVTYTVSAAISASATGTLANTATVSSAVTDPNSGNNSATDTDTLTPQADLSITKTDGVTVVIPGGSVTYTVTASNAGPSNASGSTVTDTFPAILTGANWTCVGAGGGTCTAAGAGNIGDLVNLPAGASVTYTVNATVNPAATGTLANTATVAAGGSVTDPSPANDSATDTDNIVPPVSVTINQASTQPDPTNASPVNFTVVFGLPVTGFVGGDVTLGGAAGATTAVVTEISPNNGTTYNVAVSGMTGDGAVTASIAFGAVTGPQGEPNEASTSTDNSVFYDATAPDTIITSTNGLGSITNSTSATFDFTGDDGTGVGGVTFECKLDAGSYAACSSPKSYASLANGSHTFSVRAIDSLGNTDATPDTFTWTVDTQDPGVTVSASVADPTNLSPITITITFSESVTGFTPSVASGDLVIGGVGGTDSNPTGSGASYSFDLTPSGQGAITVQVPAGSAQDAASNWNVVSNTFNITYDSVAPTVTINQAAAQPDPTSISPVNFTVVFSEAVTGFGNVDVILGGTAGATTAVVTEIAPNDGTTYNAAVSGMSISGTITAEILDGVVEDLAGNSNDASTSTDNTVTYNHDVVPPVVVSSLRADLDPTSASSVNFTVTFSELVTGVDVSDFALTTSGVLSASVSGVSGSGSIYTVTVNSGSGNGSIRLDVLDDDSILDEALNPLDDSFTEGQAYTVTGRNSIFADVPYSHWANSYIERLYNAGITSGCGFAPLIYCPEQYVTRAEMAVFLLRSIYGSSYSPPPATGLVFNDVPATHWAAAWIEQLYEDGFTVGCSNDNYCPEQVATTRAQMAIFLLRGKYGAAYTPPAPVGLFNDVPTDYWAAAWIEQLAAEGITTGCGGGNYCPEEPLTRAQMAVFLVRTFGLP